jgi:pimeloyl-ACP methyl ester carboxylesterase
LQAEEIDKAILVGQSMGGYACQQFVIQYPEKVEAFIAVDTNPFGHYYYSKWESYILTKSGFICPCIL